MVRFYCEHCGHKIGVQDKYAGKRGKCPECGNVTAIPTESTLITFPCQNCGKTISVPKTRAGKEVLCPSCKDRFVVPSADLEISLATQDPPGQSTDSAGIVTHLDLPQEYRILNPPPARPYRFQEAIESERELKTTSPAAEDTPVTERHLPWQIDIFLYPTSTPGLVHLAFFMGAQLVLSFLSLLFFLGWMIFILNVLIALYMYWYVTECIRDSAVGRTRAPEAFATAGFGDMWSQARYIFGCYLIFLGPVFFYHLFALRTDAIYWLLLGYGAFFFPMSLLACVMFDSLCGLNPILLLASIFSTFFQYCGLVLLVATIVLSVGYFTNMQAAEDTEGSLANHLFLGTLFYGVWLYAVFIVAHLLGRFYWCNKEKLNWEV